MNLKRMSMLVVLFAFVGGIQAFGDSVVYNDPSGQASQNFTGNLANFFTVNSPVTVYELGVYNAAGNGTITGTIQVGIASVNTTTGVATEVTPTVTFHGQYATAGLGYDVFQSIVPVTLAPGFYEVDAVGFSGSDLNGNRNEGSPSGPVLNNLGGALTFAAGDSTYSFLQTIVFPTDFNGNSINGGVLDTNGAGPGPGDPDANYLALYDAGTFAATPEPGSLFLLATGLFGLAIILFRRAKASRTVLTT